MIYQFTYNVPSDYTIHKKQDCFINFKVVQQIGGNLIFVDKDTLFADITMVKDWIAVKQDVEELANLYFKNRMNATAY